MSQTCTRKLWFSAGHRVLGHENKCGALHGHNYVVLLRAEQVNSGVDSLGRVVDFSVLKDKVGSWLDTHWDHGMVLFAEDGDALHAMSMIPDSKVFVLPYNPTAENLAKYLIEEVCPSVLSDIVVRVVSVIVTETDNCWAEAALELSL